MRSQLLATDSSCCSSKAAWVRVRTCAWVRVRVWFWMGVWVPSCGAAPSVAVGLGSSTRAILSYVYLHQNNVPDYGIPFVPATNTALPAIANKQIDAVMLFAPMDGFCAAMKICRVIVDPRKGEGPKEITQLNGASGPMTVRGDFAH